MSSFPKRYTGSRLEPYLRRVQSLLDSKEISRCKDLFEGISTFYGVIPLDRVYRILTEDHGTVMSEEAFLAFCEYVRYEQNDHFYIFGEEEYYGQSTLPETEPMKRLLAHEVFVEFEDAYEQLRELKKGKPWYVPTKEEFEDHERSLEFARTEQVIAAERWLTETFRISAEKTKAAISDVLTGLHSEEHDIYSILDDIQRFTKDMTLEQARSFVPIYNELNNNTRMPANNGFTPAETEALRSEYGFTGSSLFSELNELDEEKEKERSEKARAAGDRWIQMRKTFSQLADAGYDPDKPSAVPRRVVKTGRNDPCPCGSGRKYKKCCGR